MATRSSKVTDIDLNVVVPMEDTAHGNRFSNFDGGYSVEGVAGTNGVGPTLCFYYILIAFLPGMATKFPAWRNVAEY
jgi:hypothetical protein